MAYNEKHLAKLADLKALGTKQKEVADALAERIDTLEGVGSQANVIETIKVNGTAQAIKDKAVDILSRPRPASWRMIRSSRPIPRSPLPSRPPFPSPATPAIRKSAPFLPLMPHRRISCIW